MNISNSSLQAGHHHHHHHPKSTSDSANSEQLNHITSETPQTQRITTVNHNPSVHRFQNLNENPWLLHSQVVQQGPTPPQRQHKKPAPTPPIIVASQSSSIQHLSVNNHLNQPVYLTSSTQTQISPGIATSQHSPKSLCQTIPQQSITVKNQLSSSTSLSNSSSMVNNHQLVLQTSNNNNSNFDDLNGLQSNTNQHITEMKHNSMP